MALTPEYDDFARAYDTGQNQVVYTRLAADLDTPVSLMLKLTGAQKDAFVLESVTGGEVRGRYSIIGMKPDLIWRCRGEVSELNRSARFDPDAFETQPGNPMDTLRALDIDPISFVRALPSHLRVGDVLCVHAGVTPTLPMETALGFGQNEHIHVRDHWAWVREPFLASQRGWFVDGPKHLPSAPGGLLVLHGHTVPKKWAKHASLDNTARMSRIFNRMETNARVCTDFGAGAGVGVGGCLVTDAGMSLMFAPCTNTD